MGAGASIQGIAMTTGISQRRPTPGGYASGRGRCAGFTLVEMFVVIAIILIIVALAVPGVNAMVYSSNRALAENSLRVGVAMARDAAIASSRSGDGAAVFLYEPGSKQMRIVPAEVVGQIEVPNNANLLSSNGRETQDVLAPIALGASVTLPESWMVRGYAPAGSMLPNPGVTGASWYTSAAYGGNSVTSPAKLEGNWVFPESGFYDVDQASHAAGGAGFAGFGGIPTPRQSFMVRFSARTGAVSTVNRAGLMIDPRPSVEDRDTFSSSRTGQDAWKRVDWAEDTRTWAMRVLGRTSDEATVAQLLGNNSNDTVLVKSVNRLALYDERELARGIGGRVNQETGSIYEPYDVADRISFDRTLFGNAPADQIRRNINAWIAGDTGGGPGGPSGNIFDGAIDEEDEPRAKLFTLQGYTGELTEIER
ncbi:MAG: prepilin-type N-terminal cleavage/methylation domain-containing protein [Phycisphaerales bacterium JB059]